MAIALAARPLAHRPERQTSAWDRCPCPSEAPWVEHSSLMAVWRPAATQRVGHLSSLAAERTSGAGRAAAQAVLAVASASRTVPEAGPTFVASIALVAAVEPGPAEAAFVAPVPVS